MSAAGFFFRELKAGWLPLALLTAVWLSSIFFAEIFQELTLAPLLSLLSLFVLATRRPPGSILLWIFPFVVLSYFLISPYSKFVWIRSITLALGGLITAYASHLRTRAETVAARNEKVFSQLPYPILVSDATSRIVFFNQAACAALKIAPKEMQGFSWFNLLFDDGKKAEQIERYVRHAARKDGEDSAQFQVVGFDGKVWQATVIRAGAESRGHLITTLAASSR